MGHGFSDKFFYPGLNGYIMSSILLHKTYISQVYFRCRFPIFTVLSTGEPYSLLTLVCSGCLSFFTCCPGDYFSDDTAKLTIHHIYYPLCRMVSWFFYLETRTIYTYSCLVGHHCTGIGHYAQRGHSIITFRIPSARSGSFCRAAQQKEIADVCILLQNCRQWM